MNKRIILVSLAALFTTVAYCDFFEFGPRIGFSSSKVKIDESILHNGQNILYETADSKLGFHIGAYSRISISKLFVQPELLFTSSGGTISIQSGTAPKEIQELNYNKIDIPIMAGMKLTDFFRLQAGPTFSLLLNNDEGALNALTDAKQNYQNSQVGFQIGAGLDLGKLSIDLKYEGSLSKLGSSLEIGDQSFDTDMRNNLLMVMIGINIL